MLIQNTGNPTSITRSAGEVAPASAPAPQSQPSLPDAAQATISAMAEQAVLPEAAPTPEQLQNAVNQINQTLRQRNSNLEFSIDEDTNKTVVKVVEAETGKIIRQFPSQEALAISRAIDRMQQQGILFEQQA